MILSSEQQEAITAWTNGHNVRVKAVPGGGKTFIIVKACSVIPSRCLILAYNRALCDATRKKIVELGLTERVFCFTFHGLATYCVRPTYDDIALHELLDWLKDNRPPYCFDDIDAIIVDETQDLKKSLYELIPHLVKTRSDTQYMTVGDLRQLLYDYDEEDPALSKYLEEPECHFKSARKWTNVELTQIQVFSERRAICQCRVRHRLSQRRKRRRRLCEVPA